MTTTVLTRELVFATALRLVDADGVEALSMRRLGKALDRDPMRLYRHAESKEALLDGVVELVMSELHVPVADDDWEQALRRTGHAYRDLALTHPHVVPLLVTRPLSTPLARRPLGTLRPLEQLLELLVGAGFDERGALYAYRLFMGFLHGHLLNELQESIVAPDETDDVLRLGLHRLPITEFPACVPWPARSPPTTGRASSTRASTSCSRVYVPARGDSGSRPRSMRWTVLRRGPPGIQGGGWNSG